MKPVWGILATFLLSGCGSPDNQAVVADDAGISFHVPAGPQGAVWSLPLTVQENASIGLRVEMNVGQPWDFFVLGPNQQYVARLFLWPGPGSPGSGTVAGTHIPEAEPPEGTRLDVYAAKLLEAGPHLLILAHEAQEKFEIEIFLANATASSQPTVAHGFEFLTESRLANEPGEFAVAQGPAVFAESRTINIVESAVVFAAVGANTGSASYSLQMADFTYGQSVTDGEQHVATLLLGSGSWTFQADGQLVSGRLIVSIVPLNWPAAGLTDLSQQTYSGDAIPRGP